MSKPKNPGFLFPQSDYDPVFKQQLHRLHQLIVYSRWAIVLLLWGCVGPVSVWGLRSEIALLRSYFTWTSVRYGLAYHPISAVGLGLCVGTTVATLVWQSRNILFGISSEQTKRLEKQLLRIRDQGPSHPLWRWVVLKK